MDRKRRRYSPEVREEALRQLREGVKVAEVARTLGIIPTTVQYWRDADQRKAEPPPPPTALPPDVELQMLRKEVARLRGEQAFLKKAIAFFARASESDTP